jgi:alkylation response protein AidB-like acyl-CoA dehydrogenase
MDFDFNDEQRLLKESAREVMEKEIIPIADEYDKGKLLHDRKRLKELLDKLAPLGYLGATIPEEDGGFGLDYVSWGILFEELARAFASLAGILIIISGSGIIFSKLGTPEQKKSFFLRC